MTLTPAGAALLPGARALIAQADELRRQAAGLVRSEPVRIGYVKWCPPDLSERTAGVARLRIDTWVLPSHAQSARVAEGSLDLAICWVQTNDMAEQGLDARLIGADRLYAVAVGRDSSPVEAKDTVVLSTPIPRRGRRRIATASSSLATPVPPCFGSTTAASPDPRSSSTCAGCADRCSIHRRGRTRRCLRGWWRVPIVRPAPYWTWSLVSRRDEVDQTVRAVIDLLTAGVSVAGLGDEGSWLPAADPHAAQSRSGGRVADPQDGGHHGGARDHARADEQDGVEAALASVVRRGAGPRSGPPSSPRSAGRRRAARRGARLLPARSC